MLLNAPQSPTLAIDYLLSNGQVETLRGRKPFDIKIFEQSVESNEVEIKKEVDEIQTTSFTV